MWKLVTQMCCWLDVNSENNRMKGTEYEEQDEHEALYCIDPHIGLDLGYLFSCSAVCRESGAYIE